MSIVLERAGKRAVDFSKFDQHKLNTVFGKGWCGHTVACRARDSASSGQSSGVTRTQ